MRLARVTTTNASWTPGSAAIRLAMSMGCAAGVVSPSAAGHAAQHALVEFSPQGLHWNALDEDVSVAGLLAGRGDRAQGRRGARLQPSEA